MGELNKLWFRRKRYGWGWTPVTWQGWLATIVYGAVLILFISQAPTYQSPLSALVRVGLPVITATALFIRLCYAKGESPRWQWGKDKSNNDA